MLSKTVTKKVVVLTLDEEEAEWLRAVVQNPIIEMESRTDAVMRQKFFEALSNDGA